MNEPWYRLDGHEVVPCTIDEHMLTWKQRREAIRSGEPDPFSVANTILPGGQRLSTIFLSISINIFDDTAPVLFETMLFGSTADSEEICWRYTTWDEAITNHNAIVELLTTKIEVES